MQTTSACWTILHDILFLITKIIMFWLELGYSKNPSYYIILIIIDNLLSMVTVNAFEGVKPISAFR